MLMQAVANQVLHDLILVRLLPVKKAPKKADFRKSIQSLWKDLIHEDHWQEMSLSLADDGWLTLRPFALTDAGRQRALGFLQIDNLPPKTNWPMLKGQLLVPRILGIPPAATGIRKKLKDKAGLCAYVARQRYDLPTDVKLTPTKVVEALACRLVCRELGIDATAADLAPTGLLSSLKKVAAQLPNTLTGTLNAAASDFRDAILQSRLAQMESDGTKQTDMDLPAFAATVQALARTLTTGRWGENKVFVNHIWRGFQAETHFPRLDLTAFKARLVEAHRRGLLRLERADLVEAMNSEDVRASETTFLNATYHFLLIERDRP
jgi:hypothetical protein